MVGRPPKDDSRDKQYRVRLNDEEDDMLSFCSDESGEVKSEIFRKALKSYYENAKFLKNVLKEKEKAKAKKDEEKKDEENLMHEEYDEYEDDYDYDMDGISLKRAIACPYCGAEDNINFADDYDISTQDRQMGPLIEYYFDWDNQICKKCGKQFRVSGSIWEYPMGAYNNEDINVEALEDQDEDYEEEE